jgi:dihydroxyacetone kinase-like predicted kinase
MYGKFSKLAHMLLTRDDIFNNAQNYNRVFDKVINRVIDTDWEASTEITFICRKHDTKDTYNIVAATLGDVYSDIEWYIGPTCTKEDLIKSTLSNTLMLTQFLQDCVEKIEAENALG